MDTKLIEVRDRMTCMPVLAVTVAGTDGPIARHAGFGAQLVYFIDLAAQRAAYDPYCWSDRTRRTAHQWLEDNWNTVTPGSVVDVRVILGEADAPAAPECR